MGACFEFATVARLLQLPWRGWFRCRDAAASAVDSAADRRKTLKRIRREASCVQENLACVCVFIAHVNASHRLCLLSDRNSFWCITCLYRLCLLSGRRSFWYVGIGCVCFQTVARLDVSPGLYQLCLINISGYTLLPTFVYSCVICLYSDTYNCEYTGACIYYYSAI